ncbi:hypothetical protein AAFN46_20545, partial [Pseudomonas sp. CAU 1711]|uniref:hypothetical protein n=1 Tax=Pseudomonas sp. CAU 1711 TaxID=3140356 RepID=UPI003261BB63
MTTDNFKGNLISGLAGGQINGSVRRLMGVGGKIDYTSIAADAFGNAIGNGLIEASLGGNFLGPKEGQLSQREIEAYKLALAAREAGRGLGLDNAQASVNWYRGEMSTDIDPYVQMLGGKAQAEWISLKQQRDAENTFGLFKALAAPLVAQVELRLGAAEFGFAGAWNTGVEAVAGATGLGVALFKGVDAATGYIDYFRDAWSYELKTDAGKGIATFIGGALAPVLERYESAKSWLGDAGFEKGGDWGAGIGTLSYMAP